VCVVAILTASILALGWLTIVYPEHRSIGSGRVVEITISKGSSARAVAEDLYEK
jgi:cell division protein YceG involved in septum cleavage